MIGMKDIIKPFGTQGFLVGMGVAALGYFLAPQLKKTLRPVAVKGTQGVMSLGSKTKHILEDGKDKISNFITQNPEETGDSRMDSGEEKGFSSQVLKELMEEREASNRIMSELKDSILSLKEEISNMKRGESFQEG